MRRVIQIATTGFSLNERGTYTSGYLIALCDDGTLWRLAMKHSQSEDKWEQLPEVREKRG